MGTGGQLAHFWFVAHLLVFYLVYIVLDAGGFFDGSKTIAINGNADGP